MIDFPDRNDVMLLIEIITSRVKQHDRGIIATSGEVNDDSTIAYLLFIISKLNFTLDSVRT